MHVHMCVRERVNYMEFRYTVKENSVLFFLAMDEGSDEEVSNQS